MGKTYRLRLVTPIGLGSRKSAQISKNLFPKVQWSADRWTTSDAKELKGKQEPSAERMGEANAQRKGPRVLGGIAIKARGF